MTSKREELAAAAYKAYFGDDWPEGAGPFVRETWFRVADAILAHLAAEGMVVVKAPSIDDRPFTDAEIERSRRIGKRLGW